MSKKLPTWVEEEEFRELVLATKNKRHKLIFLLAFGSGLRVSEIVTLHKDNINLVQKSMMIRNAKGGKDRVVPMPKGFKNYHLDMLPMNITTRAAQKAFEKAAIKTGLKAKKPNASLHKLRHGFATRLITVGMPVNQVQILLGHSNIATTSIYTHANPKEALDNYERIF